MKDALVMTSPKGWLELEEAPVYTKVNSVQYSTIYGNMRHGKLRFPAHFSGKTCYDGKM